MRYTSPSDVLQGWAAGMWGSTVRCRLKFPNFDVEAFHCCEPRSPRRQRERRRDTQALFQAPPRATLVTRRALFGYGHRHLAPSPPRSSDRKTSPVCLEMHTLASRSRPLSRTIRMAMRVRGVGNRPSLATIGMRCPWRYSAHSCCGEARTSISISSSERRRP